MKNHTAAGRDRLYLGVDVGGTKVQASLVRESGGIVERERGSKSGLIACSSACPGM